MLETETITRAYELGYLFVPTAAETEIPALVETLKGAITAAGGTVHSDGIPEFIDLAYTMEKSIASKKFKYSQGYFGWIKFEATPDSVELLKKTLDGTTDVIRYLLIKTDLANMVIFKKPKVEAIREMASLDEDIIVDDSTEDELKEDHELLPDLAADVADVQVQAPVEEGNEEREEA